MSLRFSSLIGAVILFFFIPWRESIYLPVKILTQNDVYLNENTVLKHYINEDSKEDMMRTLHGQEGVLYHDDEAQKPVYVRVEKLNFSNKKLEIQAKKGSYKITHNSSGLLALKGERKSLIQRVLSGLVANGNFSLSK